MMKYLSCRRDGPSATRTSRSPHSEENRMSQALIDAITEMREEDALGIADRMLASGGDPIAVLDACRDAMSIIGQRFEEGDCFIPELILAGEMLGQISARMKPHLQA